jgi:hypothetical protein
VRVNLVKGFGECSRSCQCVKCFELCLKVDNRKSATFQCFILHALRNERPPGDSIPPSYRTLWSLNSRKRGKEKHNSETPQRPKMSA